MSKENDRFRQWLLSKLEARHLSISGFINLTGARVAAQSLYSYFRGETKPRVTTLKIIVKYLSEAKVFKEDGTWHQESVTLEEALAVAYPSDQIPAKVAPKSFRKQE